LLIDPKQIKRPRGREKTSVSANNLIVPKKPSKRDKVTV
jgi:hypothetical protein